jgi:MFS transporter, DHA3 family, macrolide efflux protein
MPDQIQITQAGLRFERRFHTLLFGDFLSKTGDGVHELVFIVTLLSVTQNRIAEAGLVYLLRFIPFLFIGPLGGVLADRISRRALMVGSDAARALITIFLCVMMINNLATPAVLALSGMAMTLFRALFQPAYQAALPTIVRPHNRARANSITQVALEVGGIAGPALGAVLLAASVQPGLVLLLDAVTFLASCMCVFAIDIPKPAAALKAATPLSIKYLYADFANHLQTIRRARSLWITIVYSSACILVVGAALRILIPALIRDAGFPDSHVGYATSLIALGTIAGAGLCARLVTRYGLQQLMKRWAFYGASLIFIPFCVTEISYIMAACFVLGVAGAFVDITLVTHIQTLSNETNMGKNFGLFSTLANTGEALSGTFAAGMVAISSLGISLGLSGLLVIAVAIYGLNRGKHIATAEQ